MNINTREYWNTRFGTGNWEEKNGRLQTRSFAEAQVEHFKIDKDFSGTILDFGCGLGDAIPVYREHFPAAKLYGMDISDAAIENCKARYGHLAEFMQGDHTSVPEVDVIISSNVFEHLSDDKHIAQVLLKKCKELYITVPYNEALKDNPEHVNSYTEDSFNDIGYPCTSVIFASRGWSQFGMHLCYLYFKNTIRLLTGKRPRARNMQIMFHLTR